MFVPTKIKLKDKDTLTIEWNDGKTFEYPLRFLRDESPDAGNKGETILWKHYEPLPKGPEKPGMYEIANIEQVGNYAITFHWKDGNADGIYPFDLLRTWGEYLEVSKNLHQDFEHHHNDDDKSK